MQKFCLLCFQLNDTSVQLRSGGPRPPAMLASIGHPRERCSSELGIAACQKALVNPAAGTVDLHDHGQLFLTSTHPIVSLSLCNKHKMECNQPINQRSMCLRLLGARLQVRTKGLKLVLGLHQSPSTFSAQSVRACTLCKCRADFLFQRTN